MWNHPDHLFMRVIPVMALLAIVAAGCTSSDGTETTTQPTPTSASGTVSTTTPSPAGSTTTTSLAPGSTQPPTTTTTLPGTPYTGPGPQAGDLVAVVGVAHDDVLMVRDGPGTDYDATDSLGPTATDIPVTGEARLLTNSIWYEIIAMGESGWVNGSYIGLFGATDDATAEVLAMLGDPLADDDLGALGATIANAFLGEEGGGWIALVEPSEGGSAAAVPSITYDVVGLADDAVKGYRLVIHATRDAVDQPFVLHSVERTHICWRGVDGTGFCV